MRNIKDKIIKIVLIAIIILLLVHNCVLLKNKNEKTPSGNVNIIEITCEDNDKCDVKPEDKNKKDNDTDKKDNDGNKDNDTGSNTTIGTNASSNGDEQSADEVTNSDNNGGNTTDDENDDDETEELSVFDSNLTWQDTTQLKIFTDSVYNFDHKIAPESSNTYQFVVKNSTKYKLKYDISFVETNPYHINMKYKLKKNDTYIVDHYVSYSELDINNQILNSKTNDTFYLEWKWISSDNDNDAGENGAGYKLEINVKAESTDE